MNKHIQRSFALGLVILTALFVGVSTSVFATNDTAPLSQTPEQTPAPVVASDGGLKIENVKVATTRQENSVTWTVNNTALPPEFDYGTSRTKVDTSAEAIKQNDGSYRVNLTNLKPGTLYYFVIKVASTTQVQRATYSASLITRGYPVQLTIEQNNLTAPNALVKIENRVFTANSNAIITTELSDGLHNAYITPHGSTETYSTSFTVVKKPLLSTGSPEIQSFALIVTVASTKSAGFTIPPELLLASGGVVIIAIVGFLAFFLMRHRRLVGDASGSDANLLAATYGDAIKHNRKNTPEPNLDTVNLPQMSVHQVNYENETPAASLTSSSIAQPLPVPVTEAPATITDSTASVQPSTNSIPSTVNMQPEISMHTPPPTPEPMSALAVQDEYSEAEQLSPELTQVESSQQTESEQTATFSGPSAVYDESTGELEILHQPPSQETHIVSNTATIAQPQDPTLLSIHQANQIQTQQTLRMSTRS